MIQPNGLALGLENGKKFSKTIQEVKIPFAKGDCFVFYTDGFTEAMNKKLEEDDMEYILGIAEGISDTGLNELKDDIDNFLKTQSGIELQEKAKSYARNLFFNNKCHFTNLYD